MLLSGSVLAGVSLGSCSVDPNEGAGDFVLLRSCSLVCPDAAPCPAVAGLLDAAAGPAPGGLAAGRCGLTTGSGAGGTGALVGVPAPFSPTAGGAGVCAAGGAGWAAERNVAPSSL